MQTIAFVGDIHCGSHCGLWPEDWLSRNKSHYIGTRYLNKCFAALVKSWPKIDLLFLMGDLIDGDQRKSKGVGLFTTDLGEQTDGAIECLTPLIEKCKKVARVWGTPYHEGFDNAIGKLDTHFGIKSVRQVMDIGLEGGILNVAHHPSGAGAINLGAATDRENLYAAMAAQTKKVHAPRWIVRAHKHTYFYQDTETCSSMITPCFELPTAHAKKQNYFRFWPSIGGVLMVKDKDAHGGYVMRPTLFDVPRPEVVRAGDLE